MDIKLNGFIKASWCYLLALCLAALATPALAVNDIGDMAETEGVFRVFLVDVSNAINNLNDPASESGQFVTALFLTLVIFRLAWLGFEWVVKKADLADAIYVILLILVVSALMTFFNTLTAYVHDWSTGFAGAVQEELIGTDDPFFGPAYLGDIMHNMRVKEASFWDVASSFVGFIVLDIASSLLSVMAWFVIAWATWGYALAKMIGWMLIPFILVPQTSDLFKKWIGFFMGFIFYEIIGRINVALVLLLMTRFFNLPIGARTPRVVEIDAAALSDMTGLLSMMFIGILSLASTGKFAAAFAGVMAAGGGGGGALKGIAMKIAKGF